MEYLNGIEALHFLRPWWLAGIPLALIIVLLLRHRQATTSRWATAIDSDLLQHLLHSPGEPATRSPLWLLFAAWTLALAALAGPAWQKTPQPIHEREDALVIILDLTTSMYATDVAPNRLVRAKRKLADLLKQRNEGVTGLIVFAGDAHTVSPLTDDTNTVLSMMPAVTPEIMPAPGSQLAPALQLAANQFNDAGVASGRILVITDEVRDLAATRAAARNLGRAYPVSFLAVGTAQGAPVPVIEDGENRGYLKDATGNLVLPGVNFGNLEALAADTGGRFSRMTLDDDDLAYLLADQPLLRDEAYRETQRDFDVWREEGPWLVLLLLPIAALAFRRGWLLCLLVTCLPIKEARADWWDDLWQSRDQQGVAALEQGDAASAAELFEDSRWRAAASYRNEDYGKAAEILSELPGGEQAPDTHYNLGNALARQGRLEDAIKAYDEALANAPDHEDAQFNRALIEELLQQRQEQEQQAQQSDEREGDEQQQDDQQGQQEQADGQQSEQQDQAEQGQQQQQQQDQQQSDQQEQSSEGNEESRDGEQQIASEDAADLDEEQQQALQQWLRRVPDDPGGLLRRKFEQQYDTRRRRGESRGTDENQDW